MQHATIMPFHMGRVPCNRTTLRDLKYDFCLEIRDLVLSVQFSNKQSKKEMIAVVCGAARFLV